MVGLMRLCLQKHDDSRVEAQILSWQVLGVLITWSFHVLTYLTMNAEHHLFVGLLERSFTDSVFYALSRLS